MKSLPLTKFIAMTGAENGPKVVNNPTGTKSKLDIDVFISNLLDPKWAGKQVSRPFYHLL